jgi:hypothetical protein
MQPVSLVLRVADVVLRLSRARFAGDEIDDILGY